MRTSQKVSAFTVGAAALALGMLATAQTNPPTTTPPRSPTPTTPERPQQQPPTPARPTTPAPIAAVRPYGTDACAVTLAVDTVQFYKDANFKDNVVQIDVTKGNKAIGPIELTEGLEDSLSSVRWNLSPGVVVMIYEDDGAKGEQFILFGNGQCDSLAKFDFDNKASQWTWCYAGGVASPAEHIRAGQCSTPPGAEPASSLPENTLQLFKSKNFSANEVAIANLTSKPMGQLQELPQDLPDSLTSLRWNLPAGTVVMFFQDADGMKQRAAIWGNGQLADIDAWDFNDKVSRWAWYNVSGVPQRLTSAN